MGAGGAGRRHARSHALGLERPVPSDAEPVAVLDVHDGAVGHGPGDADVHAVTRADGVPARSADPAGPAEPAADDPAGAAGTAADRPAVTAGAADDRAGAAGSEAHDPAGAAQPPAGARPDRNRRVGSAHSGGGTDNTTTTDAVRGVPALTRLPDARVLATVRDT
ncbi:hypothetical protein ACIA6T_06260 [Streptomyces sp. NPDC051740]|uniref:hypothetical protein n=1 Tax=Streptomyces sp. NPDC051740 TaxID=3365673 RepID=UPI0037915E45